MKLTSLSLLIGLFAATVAPGCGGTPGAGPPSGPTPAVPGADAGAPEGEADPSRTGKSYANQAEAPAYDGAAFTGMQVLDAESGAWLDEAALITALESEKLVFFGEQHETAPVQELELWLLQRLTERHADVSLAMEHFQRDEQPVIDEYLAGRITSAQFEQTSQPWKNYARYWKPLVEHMKAKGRPVVALNVPKEALDGIYAAHPQKPLTVFNGWGASLKYDGALQPRPLPAYDAAFKAYFESSFDFNAHNMGMTYADALDFFTDLAHIRDETMAFWTAKQLASGRVMVVAGDWHVQTGLATPDRAVRYAKGAATTYALVTTTPESKLAEVRAKSVSGRKLARFVLVYKGI